MRVYSEADFPADWAMTQSNLGNAYLKLPIGDRAENLAAPLSITRPRSRCEPRPSIRWSGPEPSTTSGWPFDSYRRATSTRICRAISCYEAALRVYTEADFPADWARIQHSMGVVHQNIQDDDRSPNVYRAVDHYKAALRVYTEADWPEQRSLVLSRLAVALKELRNLAK